MKRILMSLGAIVFVGAVAWGATGAFFTDSQTSTGNTFSAGGISLQVDSTQHYNNAICSRDSVEGPYTWHLAPNQTPQPDQYPVIGSPCTGTWTPTTLGPTNKFFNFSDIKPQDMGENTISLHNVDNAAWACMDLSLTNNSASSTVSGFNGNLANNIQVFLWQDNGTTTVAATSSTAGDNIYTPGSGDVAITPAPVTLASLFGGNVNGPATTTVPLADSTTAGGPLGTGGTGNVGFAWCAGTMTVGANGAISCNGSSMGNSSEFNSLSADITLRVSQSRNQPTFACGSAVVAGPQTIVVGQGDLDPNGPNPAVVAADGLKKWFFYNDTNDTVNNTLGSFVAGPLTPPAGTGSAFMTATSSVSRTDLATTQFGGTALSSISQLAFSDFSPVPGSWSTSEAPFVRFNVDFNNIASYQNSLVYVPANNGSVTQGAWQTWDMINGGTALWVYSGATWPAPLSGAGSVPKTWSAILAAYPNIKMHASFPFLGVRVGEPGPAGYNANVDKFQINTGSGLKTYDFGN